MTFLLLLSLLTPAYSYSQEQTNTADEHRKTVDACVATYTKALLFIDVMTAINYKTESEKMVTNLKKSFTDKKSVTRSEYLLARAIEHPDDYIGFPSKEDPTTQYAYLGSSFTNTVFHREILASLYETLYEKARHKKFYDTDHTIEAFFPDPATFKKATQFHYYDQTGKARRIILPKDCFPASTQESLTTYANNLKEDELVPYIDGIKTHALCTLMDVMHEPLIKEGDEFSINGLIDTKTSRKHIGMCIVRKDGEMIIPATIFNNLEKDSLNS